MRIRPVQASDLEAVFAIYNREIREGVATLDTAEVTPEQQRAWFAARTNARHPGIVALDDDGRVLGFANLGAWSPKCGYARAAEVSVYVRHDAQGRGVGRALLAELIRLGRDAGLGVLLARMESTREGSRRLHESLGFVRIGTLHRVGEKFGRVLDVDIYECHLDRYERPGA
ncbi:MAG: GNAT family N-acetyltransferase [Phycisphaerales bacterium]